MLKPWMVYSVFFFLAVQAIACFVFGEKWRAKRGWWWGCGVLLALAAAVLAGTHCQPRPILSDFCKAYFPAGQAALRNPASMYNKLYAGTPMETVGFVNVPIVGLLFAPLAMFQRGTAMVLFTLIGIGAVLLACHLLVKLTRVTGWRLLTLCIVVMINGPLWNSIREGNLTHLVFLLLVMAIWCLANRRDRMAGLCLAIAGLIKLPMFLLAIYFGLKKRWQVMAGFCVSLLTIMGTSLLLFGMDLHLYWWRECIDPFAGRPLAAFNVQSLSGFLARCLPEGHLLNWLPMNVDWRFKALHKILLGCLLAGTAWACWRTRTPKEEIGVFTEFSLVLCLALIISPISWTHYYLLLVIPMALYLGNRLSVPATKPWLIVMVISALLLSPPVLLVKGETRWSRFLVSHYFFGGLLLLGVLMAARMRMAHRPRTLVRTVLEENQASLPKGAGAKSIAAAA